MLPSSPVVSLSSDTINQVCRESVTGPDLMNLWSSWQHNVEPEMWPYNSMEPWLVHHVARCNICCFLPHDAMLAQYILSH